MPIRFRCAYCNQLMGISRRKVGKIVRCPKCSGQVVVPDPDEDEPEDEGDANAGAQALEDPELEKLLAGAMEVSPKKKATRPLPEPKKEELPEIDVEPVDLPVSVTLQPLAQGNPPGSIVVPKWLLAGLATVVLLLLGLAFLIGYWLGKPRTEIVDV